MTQPPNLNTPNDFPPDIQAAPPKTKGDFANGFLQGCLSMVAVYPASVVLFLLVITIMNDSGGIHSDELFFGLLVGLSLGPMVAQWPIVLVMVIGLLVYTFTKVAPNNRRLQWGRLAGVVTGSIVLFLAALGLCALTITTMLGGLY
jgi:hypothetical protein